ncbi:MAG: FAD-dependent oxidoreductase [Pseudomonadota bacterium]
MGRPSREVTILGAGIIGVCCALTLLERGFKVRVIDRLPPGEATSYGNAGVISPYSIVPQCTPGVWKNVPAWLLDPKGPVKLQWRHLPQVIPWVIRFLRNTTPERVDEISASMALLMRDNVDAFRHHLRGTGHESLIVDAMNITVFRGSARPDRNDLQFRLREEIGCEIAFIHGDELRDLEPALSPDYTAAALIKGQARTVNPGKLTKVLAEKAARLGAEFKQAEMKALHPQPDGSVTITTEEGALRTEKLILAGGIWSAELLKPLGYKLPLMAERGYHLEFKDPGIQINNSIADASAKVIASSMSDGVRIAGTAEFASIAAAPNFKRADVLEPLAKRLFPGLKTATLSKWMGIRPSFPDNLPAIGALDRFPNIIAAFGHSHYGLGMAPGTARLVAEELVGGQNQDLSGLSASRFTR